MTRVDLGKVSGDSQTSSLIHEIITECVIGYNVSSWNNFSLTIKGIENMEYQTIASICSDFSANVKNNGILFNCDQNICKKIVEFPEYYNSKNPNIFLSNIKLIAIDQYGAGVTVPMQLNLKWFAKETNTYFSSMILKVYILWN